MIMKIKFDAENNPTEYIQFNEIAIDDDKQYAIVDDGYETHYEIVVEGNEFFTSGEGNGYSRKYISLEILTDNLVSIQKWEIQTPINEEIVAVPEEI